MNALRLKDKEVSEGDLRYLAKYTAIKEKIGLYLNKNFFQLIVNLKQDTPSVSDFLEHITIRDASTLEDEDENEGEETSPRLEPQSKEGADLHKS